MSAGFLWEGSALSPSSALFCICAGPSYAFLIRMLSLAPHTRVRGWASQQHFPQHPGYTWVGRASCSESHVEFWAKLGHGPEWVRVPSNSLLDDLWWPFRVIRMLFKPRMLGTVIHISNPSTQAGVSESQGSLGYIVSSRIACTTVRLWLKNQQKGEELRLWLWGRSLI